MVGEKPKLRGSPGRGATARAGQTLELRSLRSRVGRQQVLVRRWLTTR